MDRLNFSKHMHLPNDSILEDYMDDSGFEMMMHLYEICNATSSEIESITILSKYNEGIKFLLNFSNLESMNRLHSYLEKFNGNTKIYHSKYSISVQQENQSALIIEMIAMS